MRDSRSRSRSPERAANPILGQAATATTTTTTMASNDGGGASFGIGRRHNGAGGKGSALPAHTHSASSSSSSSSSAAAASSSSAFGSSLSLFSSSPSSTRFLDRDGPFRQAAYGHPRIQRVNRPHSLATLDWLHSLLHKSTYKLLFGVALAYLAVVILFAPLFLAVNEDAALELHNFGEAAALSLETLMTIGCE